ncbi:MAG: ribonuclease H-like domain-containing protein [Blastocatellia bacterium]
MLQNTFCHIPGISARIEQRLWNAGIHSWQQAGEVQRMAWLRGWRGALTDYVSESLVHLAQQNAAYFGELLPSDQTWRLFPEFRDSIAYLDIETTGLGREAAITTIAIYDGHRVRHYVQKQNLHEFLSDIRDYKVLVTYNGKAFDVPFIERYLKTKLSHVHIDLMYVLRSLGYTGGLKGCEKKLGLDRQDLSDVDGYFAVLLWQDYLRSRSDRTLETLLAYNAQDVLNLETLLVKAYNLKLGSTPFRASHALPESDPSPNPFTPDRETINRLKKQHPFPTWERLRPQL